MSKIKLCASNIGWKAEDDAVILPLMADLGYTGLEIAPTRIFPQNPYSCLENAAETASVLKNRFGFVIPSMQSIWYGQTGSIFSEPEAARLRDYTIRAYEFAEAVGCPSLVFGCPRNRNVPENHSADEADRFFSELGEAAAQKGLKLALEANPPMYNTNFLNTTAQVGQLLKKLNNPGLSLNLDIGAMLAAGETAATVKPLLPYVSHVHISRPGLAPVEPEELDGKIADLLKENNYSGFVSLEMKTCEPETVEKSLRYLAEVFL